MNVLTIVFVWAPLAQCALLLAFCFGFEERLSYRKIIIWSLTPFLATILFCRNLDNIIQALKNHD